MMHKQVLVLREGAPQLSQTPISCERRNRRRVSRTGASRLDSQLPENSIQMRESWKESVTVFWVAIAVVSLEDVYEVLHASPSRKSKRPAPESAMTALKQASTIIFSLDCRLYRNSLAHTQIFLCG